MIAKNWKAAAIVMAAPALAFATPASAAAPMHSTSAVSYAGYDLSGADILGQVNVEHGRHRGKHKRGRDYRDDYRGQDNYYQESRYDRRDNRRYDEPVYRDTRIWRGNDGRYYCKKENGTTGLLIGGVVGGLAGRELAGNGDRTLGAIIGAAGGAILGRAIDRSNSRCQ